MNLVSDDFSPVTKVLDTYAKIFHQKPADGCPAMDGCSDVVSAGD